MSDSSGSTATVSAPIKGSFTLPDLDGFVYSFVYNPPTISVAQKAEYGAICVPGASHPVYQYGSGGEQIISFDLFIDGERGIVANGAYRKGGANGLDIRAEVHLLESLVIPLRYDPGSYSKTRPPILIFNFGSRFVNVECIMKSVNTKYTQFTADGAQSESYRQKLNRSDSVICKLLLPVINKF